jgi:hypothetical protein
MTFLLPPEMSKIKQLTEIENGKFYFSKALKKKSENKSIGDTVGSNP